MTKYMKRNFQKRLLTGYVFIKHNDNRHLYQSRVEPVWSEAVFNRCEYVPANPEKVAYAIARGFHWTIAPCGDVA